LLKKHEAAVVIHGFRRYQKMHTVVKIVPKYFTMDHHVLDVSRSVTVVSSLLKGNKEEYVEDLPGEYDKLREVDYTLINLE
jgi:cobalamin-dependent methionine synthase I